MTWEAWLTLLTIAAAVIALIRNVAGPDMVLLAALAVLMTGGAFSDGMLPGPKQAVAGFGNEGLVTIAVLLVVATGLVRTGAMDLITQPLLGRPQTTIAAQTRLMFPVAALSAFLNNTPIVAIFMPVVSDWCRKSKLSPSHLFMPLSYAAILGGTCTLIGTSTNLVVYGLVLTEQSHGRLADVQIGMFTIGAIGLPVTLVGIAYVLIAGGKLLPQRLSHETQLEDARQYTVEMLVEAGSAVEGKTIEQAGLRHLPGVFLAEIERGGERLVAVGPDAVLQGNDRLIFVGVVDSVVDLQKIRGLVPASQQVFKLRDPRPNRCLVEAVVSDKCPLIGKSIREGRFRTTYGAVVIAVHRGGEHLAGRKIGDIVLRAGDTLLIETHPRFVDQYRNSGDFFLVSAVAGSTPVRHDRASIALAILAAMVVVVSLGLLSMLNAAMLAAGLMILARCCSGSEARSGIDWRLLVAIGAALGVGQAIELSGLADAIATGLIGFAGDHPIAVLAVVYILTALFTELITNNAAAVLVFPIAIASAQTLGVNAMPFVMATMIAASASFATPIGYQTNLMVYGPGGYRFSDYLRFGVPLSFLVFVTTLGLVPRIWPM
jgi:di/tricarboxylate transporter